MVLREADGVITKMTYIQIGFLICYGIVWVAIVRNIGKTQIKI